MHCNNLKSSYFHNKSKTINYDNRSKSTARRSLYNTEPNTNFDEPHIKARTQ